MINGKTGFAERILSSNYIIGLIVHSLAVEFLLAKIELINEPRREKTGLRGFRPGPTQTGLYKLRKELEA